MGEVLNLEVGQRETRGDVLIEVEDEALRRGLVEETRGGHVWRIQIDQRHGLGELGCSTQAGLGDNGGDHRARIDGERNGQTRRNRAVSVGAGEAVAATEMESTFAVTA